MREKVYNIITKIYGAILSVSFFGGLLPLIPYVIAMIIGGDTGEAISVFLYKQYYPWIIAMASVAVIVGLIGMYIGKKIEPTVKKKNKAEKTSK